MTAVLRKFLHFVKAANKRRVVKARRARVAGYDLSARRDFSKPECASRVLLVTTAEGWGDTLYVLGLCERLKQKGIAAALAVPKASADRYRTEDKIAEIITLDSPDAPMDAARFKPDLAIDLDYVGLRMWPERADVFRAVECFTATTSEFCRGANLFSDYLYLRPYPTVVERGAAVLGYISGMEHETPVMPKPVVTRRDEERAERWKKSVGLSRVPYVYVNADAHDADRCLSFCQTKAIINAVLKVCRGSFVVLHADKFSPEELARLADVNRVKVLPRMPFGSMSRIVETAYAAVTPDTSVVHVASAFNTPLFAIYGPNDRDYFREYAQSTAWKPLSEQHAVLAETAPDFEIDEYGYASHRVKTIASYHPDLVAKRLTDFLTDLIRTN